jgi:hypothetical protein
MRVRLRYPFAAAIAGFCVLLWLGGAASAQQKRPITDDIYDSWKSIQVSDRDDFTSAAPRFKLYQWSTTADTPTELITPSSNGLIVSDNGPLEFSYKKSTDQQW